MVIRSGFDYFPYRSARRSTQLKYFTETTQTLLSPRSTEEHWIKEELHFIPFTPFWFISTIKTCNLPWTVKDGWLWRRQQLQRGVGDGSTWQRGEGDCRLDHPVSVQEGTSETHQYISVLISIEIERRTCHEFDAISKIYDLWTELFCIWTVD